MKRTIIVTLALLLCSTLLTACNTQSAETQTNEETTTTTAPAEATTPAANSNRLYGEVAAIEGSQLTLKLMEGGMGGGRMGDGRPDGEAPEGFSMPPEGMSRPDFSMPEGMTRPEGGGPGGRMPGGELPEGVTMPEGMTRPADGMFQPSYTGEEKEITIPDGTPVVTVSFNGNTQGSISEIKVGSTVQIICNGDQISEVQIIAIDR